MYLRLALLASLLVLSLHGMYESQTHAQVQRLTNNDYLVHTHQGAAVQLSSEQVNYFLNQLGSDQRSLFLRGDTSFLVDYVERNLHKFLPRNYNSTPYSSYSSFRSHCAGVTQDVRQMRGAYSPDSGKHKQQHAEIKTSWLTGKKYLSINGRSEPIVEGEYIFNKGVIVNKEIVYLDIGDYVVDQDNHCHARVRENKISRLTGLLTGHEAQYAVCDNGVIVVYRNADDVMKMNPYEHAISVTDQTAYYNDAGRLHILKDKEPYFTGYRNNCIVYIKQDEIVHVLSRWQDHEIKTSAGIIKIESGQFSLVNNDTLALEMQQTQEFNGSRVKIDQAVEILRDKYPDSFYVYEDQVKIILRDMQKEGIFDLPLEQALNQIQFFLERFFHHLTPSNPLTHPREFIINTSKFVGLSVFNMMCGHLGDIHKLSVIATEIYELTQTDFSSMSQDQFIDFIAAQTAEIVTAIAFDRAVKRVAPFAKRIMPSSRSHEVAEVVTPEGERFATPANETESLCREGDFSRGGTRQVQKVAKMKDFFEKFELGKKLHKFSVRTNYECKGQKIFRLDSKIDNPYLKKGYHYHLDSLHYDHLEVYNKNGNIKYVVNLDGTINKPKTAVAIHENRSIPV